MAFLLLKFNIIDQELYESIDGEFDALIEMIDKRRCRIFLYHDASYNDFSIPLSDLTDIDLQYKRNEKNMSITLVGEAKVYISHILKQRLLHEIIETEDNFLKFEFIGDAEALCMPIAFKPEIGARIFDVK